MHSEISLEAALRERVLDALGQVIDPEVGLDIVSLGLVYGIQVNGDDVRMEITMTTAACPLGEQIAGVAERHVAALPGVTSAEVRLVWEPPWTPDRMSDAARRQLGWDR